MKANEKRRRVDWCEFAGLSSSLRRQSHILLAIVSLLNARWPSERDCFALISRLNIQSLRHARLARAILSQPGKSKWYLCARAIRVATIFPPPSRSMLPHWVMEHIPRRDVSADDSSVGLETLNRALFSKRSFICTIFMLFWRQRFAAHLNAPVPSLVRNVLFRLISCSRKSIIPRYTAFPFRCTSIICNNVSFYYVRELRSAKLVSSIFMSYNFTAALLHGNVPLFLR